jgi:protein-disulfide isomerase
VKLMSKREALRRHRREQARRRQIGLIAGTAALALAVVGYGIYQAARPVDIGEFVTIEKQARPYASGKALGPAEASVVVQEFSDFQCPYCGLLATGAEPQLVEQYVATGQVRWEFHHYLVVDSIVGGSESRRAAEASECANEQGEFWNFHAMLFANQQGEGQGAFSDQRLKAFAAALELDSERFNACFDAGRLAQQVQADQQLGRSLGVRGTPTVFVNGALVPNPLDVEAFSQMIEAELAKSG